MNKMYIKFFWAILSLCSSSSYAQLSDESKKNQDIVINGLEKKKDPFDSIPKPIKSMLKDGKKVKILEMFDAPSGLKGYVLSSSNGERRIFYITQDRKHAILGLIFDDNLKNITATHQQKYIDVSEFSRAGPVITSEADTPFSFSKNISENAFWVEREHLEKTIYIYVDLASQDFDKIYSLTRNYFQGYRIYWLSYSVKDSDLSFDLTLSVMSSKDRVLAINELLSIPYEKRKDITTTLKAKTKYLSSNYFVGDIERAKASFINSHKLLLSKSTNTFISYLNANGEEQIFFGIPKPDNIPELDWDISVQAQSLAKKR